MAPEPVGCWRKETDSVGIVLAGKLLCGKLGSGASGKIGKKVRVDYTFAVSAIAMGTGALLALGYGWALANVPRSERGYWRLFSCAPFLIPSYLFATVFLGWLGRNGWLGPFQGGAAGRVEPIRIWACGVLLGVSGWPLVLLLTSWAWERLEPCWREAAEMELRARDRWLYVYLPLFGRPAMVGLGLLFLWSSIQFMVPLALGVPVAAVRIYARFNTYFQLSRALSGSLWAMAGWLLIWMAWVWLIRGTARVALPGISRSLLIFERCGWFRPWVARGSMLMILLLLIALPLGVLVRGRGAVLKAFVEIALFDQELLFQTVLLAAGGAFLATLLGCGLVLFSIGRGQAARGVETVLDLRDSMLLLPWLMPGVLLGAVCVRGLSSLSWTRWFYPSVGFLVLLLAIRVLFVSVKVLRMIGGTLERSWFEAAEIHQLTRLQVLFRLVLPFVAPGLFVAWSISYWLILAETGLVVMTAPPGMETLMMRVFHLLHYGYEDEVAAACLWILVLGLGPLVVGVWAQARIGRRRPC